MPRLGGEVSNLDLGLQRTSCCRYTTPESTNLPTNRATAMSSSCTVRRSAGGLAASGSVALRHGLTDQEAPQAHAQEEAQEAAEEDPLATSSAGQVGSGRPIGAAVSRPAAARGSGSGSAPRPGWSRRARPTPDRRPRRAPGPRSASAAVLEHDRVRRAAARQDRGLLRRRPRPGGLNSTSRGSTCSAAAERSLTSCVRTAELVPRRGTPPAVEQPNGGVATTTRAPGASTGSQLVTDPARRARIHRACRTARRRRATRATRGITAERARAPRPRRPNHRRARHPAECPLCSSISNGRAARLGRAPREVRRVGRHAVGERTGDGQRRRAPPGRMTSASCGSVIDTIVASSSW